ncbi:SIMPL domain-containing protein [Halocynthiibacter styelae]|uniref:SIMPL domain-containing protein n=1 Tax=Halocynthiibacter styelae TaxID=2761955 RepID=A0A8J7IVH1_9RHOB|nr:SIMPL domain-containing protein [Paenihalocynthiibacter styelae]MBI1493338.1 SIMPL domain-containing protein [Paenihalocynthiibacter styelae]
MRFLTMMTAAICLAGSTVMAVAENAAPRVITVQGQGQVSVVPDMAQVSIGVETRAANAAEAMAGTSDKMAALMAVATEAGVEARDQQTSNLNLRTDLRHTNNGQPPQVMGYIATNMLTIRLRDLDSAPQILDQLVSAGANQLHGVQFTVQDPKPHLDEARQLAVADALAKAALYAQAAGAETGNVLRIEEPQSGGGGVYPMARMEMAASAGVPMAAGEQNIAASINLVIEIAD